LTCRCLGNTVVTCNLFGSKLSSNLNLEFSRGLIGTRDRLKRGKRHAHKHLSVLHTCSFELVVYGNLIFGGLIGVMRSQGYEIETIFDKKCRSWVKLEGTWNYVFYDVACLEAVL
jgi:hypothetical protein